LGSPGISQNMQHMTSLLISNVTGLVRGNDKQLNYAQLHYRHTSFESNMSPLC